MSSNSPQTPGFFPNVFSVFLFTIILGGMVLGLSRIYPLLISKFQADNVKPPELVEVSDIPEKIAPFIRGVISGIDVSRIVSSPSDEPLNANEIKGFEGGIQAALLAAKNWYNLDRQLFRIKGIAAGVTASVESSKTEKQRGTQTYQIKLIQQIETALQINIGELLAANVESRERVLRDYLDGLKKLSGEAAIELGTTERIISEARSLFDTQTGIVKEYDESFLYNLEPTDDKNLETYMRARNQLDQSSVVIRSTGQILNRLAPLTIRLNQVIAAVEANFQALSTGTRVVPTPGVDLPIFGE